MCIVVNGAQHTNDQDPGSLSDTSMPDGAVYLIGQWSRISVRQMGLIKHKALVALQ